MDKKNIKYSDIIICNYDLIRRNKEVFEFLRNYDWGIVFYDNAHKAVTQKTIDVLYIKAEHKYALASTINRSDSKENELIKIFRSAMYNITAKELVQKLYLKNLIYKKLEVSEFNKEQYIRGVIDNNSDKSILVVGYSVKSMKSIAKKLNVMLINKDTNQNERNKIVESFNNKKEKVVCCSNLIERYGFTDIDIMIDIGYRGKTPIEDHFRVGTLISTINQLDKKTYAFKYYLIGNELESEQVENKVRFLKEFIVCSYDDEGGIDD